MRIKLVSLLLSLFCVWISSPHVLADEPNLDVLAGHSFHGEAFNEGPRQAAYLMHGMGNIVFPTSTKNELAQRFINQGVAQLYGFWYYEAERSFRQAAVLDPDSAIAYWGMAQANTENLKRARDFINQAVERKQTASRREQLYITAFENFCKENDKAGKKIEKKARAQKYTEELEVIVEDFPDDVDAKAMLALQLWQNGRADLPIVSHVAINSVLQDVFDADPMHPAHHFRIHLWDGTKPKLAIHSAAMCGPSLPGIAHMWHMPGHTYDKLHRYQDAAWQQEASARVDHAHMMRDRVLPDQIHNYAHNNEWLIRSLLKLGRVQDALSLAKNMQELPRHPKYNTLKKGSSKYGRERLLLALSTYRLWPELIELAQTMYLEPTKESDLQIERLRYLGVAYALNGNPSDAQTIFQELQTRLEQTKLERQALKDSDQKLEENDKHEGEASETVAKTDPKKAAANRERRKKEREQQIKTLDELDKQLTKAVKTVEVAMAAGKQEWKTALDGWKDSEFDDELLRAEWLLADGRNEEALKAVDKEVNNKPGQLLPMAVKTFLLHATKGAAAARESFEQTRVLATAADLDTPLLQRLVPIAAELDVDEHWAADFKVAEDTGERPELDSLGSFRWHPYVAPDFLVHGGKPGENEHETTLKDLNGKPTLVIFYLGFGCLHCIEQLHAFSPRSEEFRESGIELMAISSESSESLGKALEGYSKPLNIPLHSDPSMVAFKAYRCFDDFEQQPLHGSFLIDPAGRVLWQDISYEPFMDVDFALEESRRLLNLAGYEHPVAPPKNLEVANAAAQ